VFVGEPLPKQLLCFVSHRVCDVRIELGTRGIVFLQSLEQAQAQFLFNVRLLLFWETLLSHQPTGAIPDNPHRVAVGGQNLVEIEFDVL
jgi:hypothetical protein